MNKAFVQENQKDKRWQIFSKRLLVLIKNRQDLNSQCKLKRTYPNSVTNV
jgi:hypothetical protein